MLLRSSSAPLLPSLSSQFDPLPLPFSSHDLLAIPAFDSSRFDSLDHDQDRLRRARSEGDLSSLRNSVACSLMSSSTHEGVRVSESCSSSFKQWNKRISSQRSGSGMETKDSILEEKDLLNLGSEAMADSLNSQGCLRERPDPSERHGTFETAQEREQVPSTARSVSQSSTSVSKCGRSMEGFLLGDGEVYTSMDVDANGRPMVCNSKGCRPLAEHEREKLGPMYMASGLGLLAGGEGYGGGNDKRCGGGGFGPESNNTDAYYQRQLHADPQNPLLLRNYANFLYDSKGDYKSSEEYYERAILACPSDGEVLSQYAKLQWDVHRDQDRAEIYYDQAIKAAPDDSHVLASYASFLWDSEDTEDADSAFSANVPPTLHGASYASSPLITSA